MDRIWDFGREVRQRMVEDFELGSLVRDKVSGLEGRLVGRVEYYLGCTQFQIQPVAVPGSHPSEAQWFESARVEKVPEG